MLISIDRAGLAHGQPRPSRRRRYRVMCLPGTIEEVREAYHREPTGHYHLADHHRASHNHEAADDHEVAAPRLSRPALLAGDRAVALSSLGGAPTTYAA